MDRINQGPTCSPNRGPQMLGHMCPICTSFFIITIVVFVTSVSFMFVCLLWFFTPTSATSVLILFFFLFSKTISFQIDLYCTNSKQAFSMGTGVRWWRDVILDSLRSGIFHGYLFPNSFCNKGVIKNQWFAAANTSSRQYIYIYIFIYIYIYIYI